jgi:phosphate transport system substrate-binding protein
MGYFGFSYFEENQGTLKALEVDGGDGCVAPSVETAQDGSYTPLSRPLFVYAKIESFQKPEVAGFIQYTLDNAIEIAEESQYVPLTDEQVQEQQAAFEEASAGGAGTETE